MSHYSSDDFETCAYGRMERKNQSSNRVMDRAKSVAYDFNQTMLREFGVKPKGQSELTDYNEN